MEAFLGLREGNFQVPPGNMLRLASESTGMGDLNMTTCCGLNSSYLVNLSKTTLH